MSDDLISRKALFNELFVRNGKVCPNHDIDNFPIRFNVKDIKQTIRNAPTAYDVDKVIEQLEGNLKLIRKEQSLDCIKNGGKWTPEQGMRSGMIKAYIEAIEIVKSGGVTND